MTVDPRSAKVSKHEFNVIGLERKLESDADKATMGIFF